MSFDRLFILRTTFFSLTAVAVLLVFLFFFLHLSSTTDEYMHIAIGIHNAASDKKYPENFDDLIDVDRTLFTDEVILRQIRETHPNVYVAHLYDAGPKLNKTCGQYVNPFDIEYNNIYWQQQKTENESYVLYGAYYDRRPAANGRTVRIIAMIDKPSPPEIAHCLLWFRNEKPAISKVSHAQYMWYTRWGAQKEPLHPFVFSCPVPTKYGNRVPDSVSLVGHPCDRATNNLRVVYNPAPGEAKKDFVVCVKALNFIHNAAFAIRLVEWVEVIKILGADKIVFYEMHVHENITRVLKYYKKAWNVEVIKTSMPGHYANIPDFMPKYLKHHISRKRLQEMIYYTDCLYQMMYQYHYVVLLDVDEVIFPLGSINTWQQLIYNITLPKAIASNNITYASFIARNVHFMDDKEEMGDWYPDIPRYMHMLQNVRRDREYVQPGSGVKAFHNSDLILSLHNHLPRACLGDPNLQCPRFNFDLQDAHLQHYCSGRVNAGCSLQRNFTLDTSIWKFKNELISAVKKALKEAGFLSK